MPSAVACDKREAFAQGGNAAKPPRLMESEPGIARPATPSISDIPKSKSSLISDNRNCYRF
jgi:hypothetical protein